MKLSVRHRFDCTPERFWEMYWSESFDEMLNRESTVDRELLWEKDEGGVVTRRVRMTPRKELPRAVASLIGSSKLIYEQENAWHRDKGVLYWQVVPTILPGKLEAKGTLEIKPSGGGCEEVVDGNISVNVRFVGGKIEQMVVDEVSASYEKTAQVCREWLAKHGASNS